MSPLSFSWAIRVLLGSLSIWARTELGSTLAACLALGLPMRRRTFSSCNGQRIYPLQLSQLYSTQFYLTLDRVMEEGGVV